MVSASYKKRRRSAAAQARRRAVQRQHQRQRWVYILRSGEIDSQLSTLESEAIRSYSGWFRDQECALTNGTSAPEFCIWEPFQGPFSCIQDQLFAALERVASELLASPFGPFFSAWRNKTREEQASAVPLWSGFEPFLLEASSRLRSAWADILSCDPRCCHSSSPIRPELVCALAHSLEDLCPFPFDLSIITEADSGLNIGVSSPVSVTGLWPLYRDHKRQHFATSMFERECFRNYQSAEENGKVVVSLLETECQKGHMREIQEDQVNRDLAEGAIFSRVSALQKPNRVPVQYRLIDDMARSGLNSLIRDSNHMLETVCLPNLRSLDRLFRLSFQLFGDDLSCCELDARAAFRHLQVSPLDEKFLYNRAPALSQMPYRYFRHCRLPFGLMTSPLLWIRCYSTIVRCVQLLLRRPLSLYVDDLAVFSPSSAVDRDFIYLTLAIQACGVELEVAKAHLTKTPTITGFAIDLPSGTYSIPQPKQRLIVDHLKVILDSALLGRPVEVRSVESALGRLMWASQCFLHYRAYLGPIYSWVKAVRHRDLRWATLNSSSTDAIRLFLSLFSVPDNLTASFLISANKVLTLDTSVVIADASLQGLGGTVSVVSSEGGSLRRWYHASFTTGPAEIIHAIHHLVPPSGSHGEYVAGDISALELLALMLGYLAARVTNQPCPLVLMSDNSATVSAVQRVFSSVPRMASLLSAASCCRPFTNLTQAFHLPGIHNCLSDSLSRAEQVPIGWDPTAQIDLGPLLLRLSTASNVPL